MCLQTNYRLMLHRIDNILKDQFSLDRPHLIKSILDIVATEFSFLPRHDLESLANSYTDLKYTKLTLKTLHREFVDINNEAIDTFEKKQYVNCMEITSKAKPLVAKIEELSEIVKTKTIYHIAFLSRLKRVWVHEEWFQVENEAKLIMECPDDKVDLNDVRKLSDDVRAKCLKYLKKNK